MPRVTGARHDLVVVDRRLAEVIGVEATAKMTRHPGGRTAPSYEGAAR
jgi:hypothetical protein